jgi:hypothetical protein
MPGMGTGLVLCLGLATISALVKVLRIGVGATVRISRTTGLLGADADRSAAVGRPAPRMSGAETGAITRRDIGVLGLSSSD